MFEPEAQTNAVGSQVREVLQRVQRGLTVAHLVQKDEVPCDVHVGVEVEFDVVHDGLGCEVAREQVREFGREAEVQVMDPAELAGTEELLRQVRLARLPGAVEQHRLARRRAFPREQIVVQQALHVRASLWATDLEVYHFILLSA